MSSRSSQSYHSTAPAGAPTPWYQKKGVVITWRILSALCKCLFTIMLVFVITGCLVTCALIIYVSTSVDVSSDIPELTTSSTASTSIVMTYNEDSKSWEEFMRLEGANHIWVNLEDIPLHLQQAVIAIEDERFLQHDGVDWKRTVSAFANMIFKFSNTEYGASTLTQQLIKQLTGDDDHTVMRKVTEILKAMELEKRYSKDEIIEAYLNLLPLTGDIKGVAVGANYYFGVDVQDLTIAQSAVIASITQNPSYYNPYTHPENVRDRQQIVLAKMYELGFITEDEYEQARGEELIYTSSINHVSVQDYYTDMVVESVINDLQKEYGYGYNQAENMVYYGGLTIYSWEDVALQSKLEKLYADESIYPDTIPGDEEDPRFAFFATDYDGKVVVTIGDRGEKKSDRVTNIATMSMRQPGSSIKPISVYDLGIEYNLFTYSSSVPNKSAIRLANGRMWPPNYGSTASVDAGNTLLYLGLQESLNTIAVQVLMQVSLERSYDYLTNVLDISTLVEDDVNYSALGLGGATYGMYLSELTSAYQIFGNGGVYNGFYCYDRVTNQNGEVILQTAPKGVQAISPDTATVMNRMMQLVIRGSVGTLRKIAGSWPASMDIFGKTGTTDANNDVLAIGGTPYYVAGAWFGYRYNNAMTYTQAQAVKQLWNLGMLALNEGKENATFPVWGDPVELTFCADSGCLAGPSCKNRRVGIYRQSNIPPVCTKCEKKQEETPTTTTTTNPAQPGVTLAPDQTDPTTSPAQPTSPNETPSTSPTTTPTTTPTSPANPNLTTPQIAL